MRYTRPDRKDLTPEPDAKRIRIPDIVQDDIKLCFDDSDSPAVGIDAIQAHYDEMDINQRFISEQCYDGFKVTYPELQIPTVLKPRTRYRWGVGSERAGSFQIDIANFDELEQGIDLKPTQSMSWNKVLPEKAGEKWTHWQSTMGDTLRAPTKSQDGLVNWQKAEWMAKRLDTEDIHACQKLIDLLKSIGATYDMVQGGFYNFISRIRENNSLYQAINELSKLSLAMDEVTVEWDNKINMDRPINELCENPEQWWIDHLPVKYHNMDTEQDEADWEAEHEYHVPGPYKYEVKGPSAQDEAMSWVSKQPDWYKVLYQRISRMNTSEEIHASGSLIFFAQQLYKVETLEDLKGLQKQFHKNRRLKEVLEQLTDLDAVQAVTMSTFHKWIRPMTYQQSKVIWNLHTNRKKVVEYNNASTFNWLYDKFSNNPNRKLLSKMQRSGKYDLLNHEWSKLWKVTEQHDDQYLMDIYE
jgi:hypothetical protein